MRPGHRAWRRPATSVSAFARTSIIALWGMKRLLALLVLGTTAHSKPAQAPRPYMLDQEIIKKTEMPTNSQTAIRIKLVSSGRLAALVGRTKISSFPSAFVRGHRLSEDELPAKPKFLPGALASGAGMVCVVSHPPFSPWLVLAL
jgi:hypothetical protein